MSSSNHPPSSGLPLPDAMAGNFQEAIRWFQQIWASSTGVSAPGGAAPGVPSMMMPTLDLGEIEKRIGDLRSVDQWLQVNQAMVRTTIQAMEMQRDTLRAWKTMAAGSAGPTAAGAAGAAGAGGGGNPEFNPALWWNALQQQFTQMAHTAAQPAAPQKSATPPPNSPPESGAAPAAKGGSGKSKPTA